MELNLIEEFILIALSDEEGKFVTDTTYLKNGIAGAILLELVVEKRIELVDKKVRMVNAEPMENQFLDQTVKAIENSPNDESLQYWMGALNANANDVKKAILTDLVSEDVLKEIKGRFLWLFSYYRYPTNDPIPEDIVRSRLHDVIDQKVEPQEIDLMLLNLIDVCSLNNGAFRKLDDRQKAKQVLNEVQDGLDSVHKATIQATLRATVASTSA